MCGRYTLAPDSEELVEAFDVPDLSFDFRPSYNVAPGQEAPVVAEDRHGRRIGLLTWGLAPAWMDEPGPGFINARCESVMDKPSFRDAFQRRRCLVPADGFYEWKRDGKARLPHWVHPTAGGLVSFAGMWERWSRPGVEPRHTFAIITTEANDDLRDVHDRMPVVIDVRDRDAWLERSTDQGRLVELLRPSPPGIFRHHAVSTRVNRPVEDDVGLVAPVG